MKKLWLFIFILFIFITPVNSSTQTAHSYVLMDQITGKVLAAKDKDNPMLIASITKIMTALLAIESGKLDDEVLVDDVIKLSHGSGIYIEVGEKIKLRDLVYGLMLRSGNDAALMIAKYVGGSVDNFVELMNLRTKKIGMVHTKFVNPSGLDDTDDGNYSTSYDMARLTREAMQYKEYREIVKTKKYKLTTNKKTYIWHNKNKLLQYNYITGGKTGYTIKAKRTLVSTASFNNLNLIVVTLKDSDDWNTHKSLYEEAFSNYFAYLVTTKKEFSRNFKNDSYYLKRDLYIPIENSYKGKILLHTKFYDKKNSNNIGGELSIYLNNVFYYKELIYRKDSNSSLGKGRRE